MNLLSRLVGRQSSETRMSLDDLYEQVQFAGANHLLLGGTPTGSSESVTGSYAGLASGALQSNGVVFSAMAARMALFSEARFAFQRMRSGRPGDLFTTAALRILESPWPNGTTGDLLSRMILDVDCAGNFFGRRVTSAKLQRLRPDWVDIVLTGDPSRQASVEVAGYIYWPGGRGGGEPLFIDVADMVHWAPYPDPLAWYRGMSWVTPIVRDVQADRLATMHKVKFFENGATLQAVIALDKAVTKEQFKEFNESFRASHAGVENAYRSMVVGGGADVTLVGANLQQLDFRSTQGAGETRIAAASGMHPVILGLSEGLSGSSLNQGNFSAARRLTSDKTMRPLWRSASGALTTAVAVPSDARLWIDDRDIAFLREDRKDLAEIQSAEADTIRTLVDGGWGPDSVKAAVAAQDWSLLVHTGMTSVQLQSPGVGDNQTPTGGGQ